MHTVTARRISASCHCCSDLDGHEPSLPCCCEIAPLRAPHATTSTAAGSRCCHCREPTRAATSPHASQHTRAASPRAPRLREITLSPPPLAPTRPVNMGNHKTVNTLRHGAFTAREHPPSRREREIVWLGLGLGRRCAAGVERLVIDTRICSGLSGQDGLGLKKRGSKNGAHFQRRTSYKVYIVN